jgi:hypothetical protein
VASFDHPLYSRTGDLLQRRALLAGAASLTFSPALRAQPQSAGVALVVGNSKYQWEASLPNVRRDTPEIVRAFQALGLKTEFVQDAGKNALQQALERFAAAARGAKLAVFYFAGHGATWENESYIVPADADLADPRTVASLTPVHAVIASLKEAANRFLVFDSCRNNPADGWKQREAAMSRSRETNQAALAAREPNTLVLYSTAPGRIALDGPPGDYSPFAAALLREIDSESVDLQALPIRLRRRLLIATTARQVLWDHNTYQQPFPLRRQAGSTSNSRRLGADSGPGSNHLDLVELGNAYSHSQQIGLAFPPGLVGVRPRDGNPHARKVGSYKSTFGRWDNPSRTNYYPEPAMFAVLSVTNNLVEVVSTARFDGTRSWWRYFTAPLSGNRFTTFAERESIKFEFEWSGEDGGTTMQSVVHGSSRPYVSRFTRLDG